MMRKFNLVENSIEVSDKYKIREGCTQGSAWQYPNIIATYNTAEEALKELKKYHSRVQELKGTAGTYYSVTEFYVEEGDYDDAGELIDTFDILEFSEMEFLPDYALEPNHHMEDATKSSETLQQKNVLEQVSVRLHSEAPLYSNQAIRTPEDAVKIVGKELLSHFDREQICLVNLNSSKKPINFTVASVGTLDMALTEPREMLKASILSNAGSVIMLHNHPSGELNPSKEDYQVTERLLRSFDAVGIKLIDHIIIGGNNITEFYSIRENDLKLFDDYRPLSGSMKFTDISEHLLREIPVFLVAEDLAYWVNNTHTTISLTEQEAEKILNYMDGHGYNLGVVDGEMVRIDVETDPPETVEYSINDAIYAVTDWNAELISEANDRIDAAYSVDEVYELRQYKKSLREDEEVFNELFKKTSLGKTLELGTVKEKNTEIKTERERVM